MSTNRHKGKKVAFLLNENGPATPADLGGKGAGLVELTQLGVPVPPAFTVTTSVARAFSQHGCLPQRLARQLRWGISGLERQTGKRFGGTQKPLLVSIRSGAAVSMPGMMDTVLNLGLNTETVRALGRHSGQQFAWDSYRRFLSMFGETVLGVSRHRFESTLSEIKKRRASSADAELGLEALKETCNRFRLIIESETGAPVCDCPWQQLQQAVTAVLKSWNNPRARTYRQVNGISHHLGTAVNIQSMVFGNRDNNSGTGVVFSRNCVTGQPGLWGEFLVNAQGEDIVSGARTPHPISALKALQPRLYSELEATVYKLDNHRRQVVDVEFTFESGVLYVLQVRNAKLAPEAAVTFATHLVWDGKASKDEALAQVTEAQVEAVRNVRFEPSSLEQAISSRLLTRGLPASPGAAVGHVVNSSEAAVLAASTGQKVVLVRPDTSPDDLPGMLAAVAIVTSTGGATSHAAVVARGLGKPAVVGCSALSVAEGDFISVDGYSGAVVSGEVQLAEVPHKKEVNLFLKWLADAQGTRWPKPRLDFETIKKTMTAGRLLNDFYLTDAIARQAVRTALELESRRLRTQVHGQVAEHIATYLVLAVCGELRYAQESWRSSMPEMAELLSDYKILEKTDSRGAAQSTTMDLLATLDQSKQVRFLQLAASVFDKGWSEGTSIGGVRWGNIARAAHAFLTGKLPHSVFADHAFDLQHNNGSVFGKHQMLSRGHDPRDWKALRLNQQLEAKKELSGVKCLFERLDALQSEWLPEVLALYRKGEKLGLWLKTEGAKASKPARGRD